MVSLFGRDFPYTQFLENLLLKKLPEKGMEHIDVSFDNVGILGDTTAGMLQRFDLHVAAKRPDYVIVWGGINDIYMQRTPESIANNLRQIYRRAQEDGINPIACTVTSILGPEQWIQLIITLNKLIKDLCKTESLILVDLYVATSDKSGRLRKTYSSDGVHLTRSGYEKVALTVYKEVVEEILDNLL
jgi:lysophospholipase L1-like esterase